MMSSTFISPSAQVSSTAIIGNGCAIGDNVHISDYCIIHDNVEIANGSFVGPFSVIGEPSQLFYAGPENFIYPSTQIGENSIIRSHSVIYADVFIGSNLQTGHRVTIRERTRIGNHVRIGTSSDIQGFCSIGNYVNMHSSVIIGQKSIIEDFVWIFPNVVLTNDPNPPSTHLKGVIVRKFAVISTACTILPGVEIAEEAVIGAHSLVKRNVGKGMLASGNPAREVCPAEKIVDMQTGLKAYPWQLVFERGMPWEHIGYEKWLEIVKQKKL